MKRPAALSILQVLPSLNYGGVERGTLDVARAIKEAGGRPLVASSGGVLVKRLEQEGIEHFQLPLASKDPLVMYFNHFRLAQIIQRHRVDIVHARSRAPAWSAYGACRKTGAQFLTTFHGVYGHHSRLKRAYNRVMTRGKLVIAPSQYVAQHLQEVYGLAKKKIRVVPRGVDMELFDPEVVPRARVIQLHNEWRLPEDKFIIMLVGRVTAIKGHLALIRTLAALNHPDLFAVMVGPYETSSSTYRACTAAVERYGLTDKVRFVGPCSDMAAAYLLADVVVVPSLKPESFGRMAAEAASMGRPIIATAHGGVPEILTPEFGWTYPADQEGMLVDRLRDVMDLSVAERQRRGRAARRHIAEHFSLQHMLDGTLAVYDELAK